MMLRRAQECSLGVIQVDPCRKLVKQFVLTSNGQRAREEYWGLARNIEMRWKDDLGGNRLTKLRNLLEHLVNDPSPDKPLLFKGLKPYAKGWRASVPPVEHLPHYPMVLHRGGFPDGS